MKAVIMYPAEGLPRYQEVAEPTTQQPGETLIQVKAVAIKNYDKAKAAGSHYSSEPATTGGRIIGGDGVGLLENGARVYAVGVTGMLAEKAVVHQEYTVPLPENLDNAIAAALPNAVYGAAMGLRFKANIQPGDVVLINGATGFTGRLAVQIARLYGAGKIIVTGRNPEALQQLSALGADELISITADDAAFQSQLRAIHTQTPVNIVIDYLWGHTAELILTCLKGKGVCTLPIRYVSVGTMTGDSIQLSAAILRSVNLQLTGSGLGSWTKAEVTELFSDILPQMFRLAAEGVLPVPVHTVGIEAAAALWNQEVKNGGRLVVTL